MSEKQIQQDKETKLQDMPSPEEENLMRIVMGRRICPEPDVDNEWAKLQQRLVTEEKRPKTRRLTLHWSPILKTVAGIAAMVTVVWMVVKPSHPNDHLAFEAIDNVVKQVTVTTGNDKPIAVKSATMDFRPASSQKPIPQEEDNPQRKMTVSTSRGMDYGFTLADGTKVWLNAESRLIFPEQFGKGNREVELKGEAYFEVAKDATHPFVVRAGNIATRVLGTEFDIKAYGTENPMVILINGKVEVSAEKAPTVVMAPGEQVTIVGDGQLTKHKIDTYPYIQWKEGFFYFDNSELINIMRELGRWYNINVVFEDVALKNVRLHFVAEKTQSINEIVTDLSALGFAHFEITDDALIVK